ncbi:hypothetical protein H5395_17470 [Paracoccus sp. MC1854]|uniref:hypothetical protein n=1 Tax=Paracoccus sp. MC1854 TaxID=2760306 RepID=UPI0016020813|nr:hypothetical protein [Paracoccus sp. MC1854]MBB1493245.1 hypothetical protein [Paracoccus sp. MC1854]
MRGKAAAAYADRAERMAKELKDSFRPKSLVTAANTQWNAALGAIDEIDRNTRKFAEAKKQQDLQAIEECVPRQVALLERIYSEFGGKFDFGPQPSEKEQRLQAITDPANRPKTAKEAAIAVAALEAEYKSLAKHSEFMREHNERMEADPEFARLFHESIKLFQENSPAEPAAVRRSPGK